jgi:peroxiredoxin Q/BCP
MKFYKSIVFKVVIMLFAIQVTAQKEELSIGNKLPEFLVLDDTGKQWNSKKELKAEFLVVYFYPAAMTGGCTKQACAYRDDKASFDALHVDVVGISGDTVQNLHYFKEAYNLNFPLLSDSEGKVAALFGVPTKTGQKSLKRELDGIEVFLKRSVTTSRWTFVFDSNGTLIYKNNAVKAAVDSKEVKKVIAEYRN